MNIQTRNIGNVSFFTKNPSADDLRETRIDPQEALKFESSVSLDFTRGKALPTQFCSTGCGGNGARKAIRPMEHRVPQHQSPSESHISPYSFIHYPYSGTNVIFYNQKYFCVLSKDDTQRASPKRIAPQEDIWMAV